MEADAVSEVFALRPRRLAKHAPAGETVTDATSEVQSERHDQVAAPRAKAGPKPEHRERDSGSGGHGQILAASEAMPLGCRVHRRHNPADEHGAETGSRAKTEHDQPVYRFMRDHQQRRESQDQQDIYQPDPNRPTSPTRPKYRRQGEHRETNYHDGCPNHAPGDGLRAAWPPVEDIWNLLVSLDS